MNNAERSVNNAERSVNNAERSVHNAERSVQDAEPRPSQAKRSPRRLSLIFALVLVALTATLLVAAQILLHRARPILRARVINTLSTRFDSRVELPELDVSVLNGLEVTGKGLKLYPRSLDSDQPLFAVGHFRFHIGWLNLLRSPMHISEVHLSDLQIYRPTAAERSQMRAANAQNPLSSQHAEEARRQKIEIYADLIDIDRARLVLATDRPGKLPLEFNIRAVQLHEVADGQPMRFHATLINPKPLGEIDSSGYFGPFDVHHPGNSPVRGDYSFSHADLNTIKGIGGILSSSGRYAGLLHQITVDGQTDTPDFSLDSGNHPMPLHTSFHAIVDGLNGNTYLEPVNATLAHSHILARGEVTRVPRPGEPGQFGRQFGREVHLDIVAGPADIGDLLRLAVKTQPPLLHGALHLSTRLDLPPGPARVPQRLRLTGQFSVTRATFTNQKVQADVDQLSLRGQGRPEEANTLAHDPARPVDSEMHGNFTLADARLTLSGVHYSVPGADIGLDGLYSLDGSQLDLHGTARLEARVSQMVTGWRSLLLKPVDPFLAKHGAGTEVPFSISGTRAEPKFGLDFFHQNKRDKNDKPPTQPQARAHP